MRWFAVVSSALFLHLSVTASPAQAAGVRLDTPSGYPVPRFVSLKDEETNCRIGPSFAHPVRYVFKRAGAPVLVVAESVDHWRKLRDSSGDECWAHQTTLRGQTHVLALHETDLLRRPKPDSGVAARIGAGVLARISKRNNGWILVTAGDARGWAAEGAVWGGAVEETPAPGD